jgi:hypothetical protein
MKTKTFTWILKNTNVLSESFNSRFEDFSAENKNIFFFINPFSITDNEMSHYTPELQLDIMDIQNHKVSRAV